MARILWKRPTWKNIDLFITCCFPRRNLLKSQTHSHIRGYKLPECGEETDNLPGWQTEHGLDRRPSGAGLHGAHRKLKRLIRATSAQKRQTFNKTLTAQPHTAPLKWGLCYVTHSKEQLCWRNEPFISKVDCTYKPLWSGEMNIFSKEH